MSDLPVFVPSTATAEASAEKLWATVTKGPALGETWGDRPAHERHFYMQRAVDMLAGAGQHLIADALAHVADHDADYGVSNPGELRDLSTTIRMTLDLETL